MYLAEIRYGEVGPMEASSRDDRDYKSKWGKCRVE